ncbi:uncharacterized protein LOC127788280 isoform X2 [Diospyros lotus]|uniref:uncharacterized protein LOC127788280 isoform X2 n=1 Tax=Diospyros lotus TaxID=55363 RepID=UPI0022534D0F|nr:uncharacterized protein LOC127788280 isoform X2 [Diospyros lotus]
MHIYEAAESPMLWSTIHMEQKGGFLLRLLVMFLVFSTVLSSAKSRRLHGSFMNDSSAPDHLITPQLTKQGEMEMEMEMGEGEEGRMVIENRDYPGTGANNHHDPKSPGTA